MATVQIFYPKISWQHIRVGGWGVNCFREALLDQLAPDSFQGIIVLHVCVVIVVVGGSVLTTCD